MRHRYVDVGIDSGGGAMQDGVSAMLGGCRECLRGRVWGAQHYPKRTAVRVRFRVRASAGWGKVSCCVVLHGVYRYCSICVRSTQQFCGWCSMCACGCAASLLPHIFVPNLPYTGLAQGHHGHHWDPVQGATARRLYAHQGRGRSRARGSGSVESLPQ